MPPQQTIPEVDEATAAMEEQHELHTQHTDKQISRRILDFWPPAAKIFELLFCVLGFVLITLEERHKPTAQSTSVMKFLSGYGAQHGPEVSYLMNKVALAYSALASIAGISLYFVLDDNEMAEGALSGSAGMAALGTGGYIGTKYFSTKVYSSKIFFLEGDVMSVAAVSVLAGLALLADAGLVASEKLS